MKLHHVGIACEDISATTEELKNTFNITEISDQIFDAEQDATLCMVTLDDGSMLELVAGNVVKTYLKKKIKQYHVCYEVKDIDKQIKRMESAGAVVIRGKRPAKLFGGRQVAFLYTYSIGMVELLEEKIG